MTTTTTDFAELLKALANGWEIVLFSSISPTSDTQRWDVVVRRKG